MSDPQKLNGLRYKSNRELHSEDTEKRIIEDKDKENSGFVNDDLFCEQIFYIDVEPDPDDPDADDTAEVRCIITETDSVSKMQRKKMYKIEGLPTIMSMHDANDLRDRNGAVLVKMGSQYMGDNLTITLPEGTNFTVPRYTHAHAQSPSTPVPYVGSKNVIVIRAIGSEPGEEPDADASTLSRRIFGGDDDNLNLKDGYAACSGNQLTMEKATGFEEIIEGVLEVQLDMSTTNQTGAVLEDAISEAAKAKLGTSQELESLFDFVMFCLPPGTSKYSTQKLEQIVKICLS